MEPFKSAISPELVRLTGRLLARQVSGIDAEAFAAPLITQLEALELKQRVVLLADALHATLPEDPERRQRALLAMLHPDECESWNDESGEEGLCGWGLWPLTNLVGRYGLGSLERALETLREMTKRGTSEFDVRPFVVSEPAAALALIGSWVDDPNHHVRRLVSEGTRPRLPWGLRLQSLVEDPEPMLPTLERLRDDPSEYVRRSVANHLNDIAKDHPERVAEIARNWMSGADENRKKLLRHACRTLIKDGHAGALAAFGFAPPEIEVPRIALASAVVDFGTALEFEVLIRATGSKSQDFILDYLIHHRKADGSLSPKVFKWTRFALKPGEERVLSRSHAIKPITTRRYYAGAQALSLRINGRDFGHESFELVMADEGA